MSQPMVQNSPSAEDVANWFDRLDPDDLAPGGVLIDVLRTDSQYAPPVDWGQPFGPIEIRPGFAAEYYQLDSAGRKWGYRYRDVHGAELDHRRQDERRPRRKKPGADGHRSHLVDHRPPLSCWSRHPAPPRPASFRLSS